MIIYAINIHTGGGKILLNELLTSHTFGKINALFHDQRYTPPQGGTHHCEQFRIKPTIWRRLLAEYQLLNYLKNNPQETVLFFGNLPPFFIRPQKSILYLQNCFLLSGVPIVSNSIRVYLRLIVEKLLFRIGLHRVNEVWVQTDWMKYELKKMKPDIHIEIRPFLPKMPIPTIREKKYTFVNVTSCAKHKNFDTFIKALKILDLQLNKKINVAVILDSKEINQTYRSHFQNITLDYFHDISREKLFQIYEHSEASVLTSSHESFCLPLYEAIHFGLKLICLDAPYAKDITKNTVKYRHNTEIELAKAMHDFFQGKLS